jgi:hypothetical protein
MTDRPHPPPGEDAAAERPKVRLSPDSLPGKRVAAILLAGIAFGLLLVLLAYLLLNEELRAERPAMMARAAAPAAVAPARIGGILQTQLPAADEGLRLRQEGEEALRHYRWVDRERGLVRLPIDVAVERLLAGDRPRGAP